MKRLKIITFGLLFLTIIIVILSIGNILLGQKRTAYNLSLLPREEALIVARNTYIKYRYELMPDTQITSSEMEEIEALANSYLESNIMNLTYLDKSILTTTDSKLFDMSSKVIVSLTVVFLIWMEVWGDGSDKEKG